MADWRDISRRLGITDAEGFARREIIPQLEALPVERLKKDGERENRLELPMAVGFFAFMAAFVGLHLVLPDNFLGVAARFVLFPVMFLGFIAGAMFLFRGRIVEALTRGKVRYIARSKALLALGRELRLTYIPSPGGAPDALKFVARQSWAPDVLKEATAVIEDHGGMDEALDIATRSGALMSDITVLGSSEQKEKYLKQQASWRQVEDGFQGARGGVPFSAFEWVESVEDAPDVYHLAMVFASPHRLHGVTQLRSRRIGWSSARADIELKPVGIVAPAFEDRFRMRSTDQVEARLVFDPVVLERVAALAHGEKVRAVAFEDNLVVDVAGENRFAMVDLVTGVWSEETIAMSMANIADMLALADAVAHAFKLRTAA